MLKPRMVGTVFLTAACLLVSVKPAHAEVITMAASKSYPTNSSWPDFAAEPVTVPAGHTAKVLFTTTTFSGASATFYFTRPNDVTQFPLKLNQIIAGPAVINFEPIREGLGTEAYGWATIKVEPETFPPGKTMILGEGTNSALIALECSTNLVNWVSCTNGFYGGSNTAMFFRINGSVITAP